MQVACTDKEFALNELKVQPHAGMLEAMAGSVFCLIMPGNSQSSQRLTEAFIAGCIPVFLGPPWHTLPFSTEASHRMLLPASHERLILMCKIWFSRCFDDPKAMAAGASCAFYER